MSNDEMTVDVESAGRESGEEIRAGLIDAITDGDVAFAVVARLDDDGEVEMAVGRFAADDLERGEALSLMGSVSRAVEENAPPAPGAMIGALLAGLGADPDDLPAGFHAGLGEDDEDGGPSMFA